MTTCNCKSTHVQGRRIVITGGPGAGKTALLEIANKKFCQHVAALPEAATIIFSGGFWRHNTLASRRAGQRAIYHVQRELEQMVEDEARYALALCDRGTVDGIAYWAGEEVDYWRELGTTREAELARYAAVIHLRTPTAEEGYNNQNPVRIETAAEARRIDERIDAAWAGHPRRYFVDSHMDFLSKVQKGLALIAAEIPECCRPGA